MFALHYIFTIYLYTFADFAYLAAIQNITSYSNHSDTSKISTVRVSESTNVTSFTSPTLEAEPRQILLDDTEECTYILLSQSGNITSPGYPGNFPALLQCDWTIVTNPGGRIKLTFHSYDLPPKSDGRCPFGYIEYGSYSDSGDRLVQKGHHCGCQVPDAYISRGERSWVYMLSSWKHYDNVYKGFIIQYETVEAGIVEVNATLITVFAIFGTFVVALPLYFCMRRSRQEEQEVEEEGHVQEFYKNHIHLTSKRPPRKPRKFKLKITRPSFFSNTSSDETPGKGAKRKHPYQVVRVMAPSPLCEINNNEFKSTTDSVFLETPKVRVLEKSPYHPTRYQGFLPHLGQVAEGASSQAASTIDGSHDSRLLNPSLMALHGSFNTSKQVEGIEKLEDVAHEENDVITLSTGTGAFVPTDSFNDKDPLDLHMMPMKSLALPRSCFNDVSEKCQTVAEATPGEIMTQENLVKPTLGLENIQNYEDSFAAEVNCSVCSSRHDTEDGARCRSDTKDLKFGTTVLSGNLNWTQNFLPHHKVSLWQRASDSQLLFTTPVGSKLSARLKSDPTYDRKVKLSRLFSNDRQTANTALTRPRRLPSLSSIPGNAENSSLTSKDNAPSSLLTMQPEASTDKPAQSRRRLIATHLNTLEKQAIPDGNFTFTFNDSTVTSMIHSVHPDQGTAKGHSMSLRKKHPSRRRHFAAPDSTLPLVRPLRHMHQSTQEKLSSFRMTGGCCLSPYHTMSDENLQENTTDTPKTLTPAKPLRKNSDNAKTDILEKFFAENMQRTKDGLKDGTLQILPVEKEDGNTSCSLHPPSVNIVSQPRPIETDL